MLLLKIKKRNMFVWPNDSMSLSRMSVNGWDFYVDNIFCDLNLFSEKSSPCRSIVIVASNLVKSLLLYECDSIYKFEVNRTTSLSKLKMNKQARKYYIIYKIKVIIQWLIQDV